MSGPTNKSRLEFVPAPVSSASELNAEAARRRTPRRAYHRSAGVLVGGCYAVFQGRSLSEGGIGVTIVDSPGAEAVLAKVIAGAPVVVTLILPSGAVLLLRGEVVHHGLEKAVGHSIGIKFESVALHQRREIRYYVSAKEAGESDLFSAAADNSKITSKRLSTSVAKDG